MGKKKRMKPRGKSGRQKAEAGTASSNVAIAMVVLTAMCIGAWYLSTL